MNPPRPILSIELAGQTLSDRVAATVSLVLVRQALGVPGAVEIDLTDPDLEGFAALRHGASLVLRVGRTATVLFSGSIVAIEQDHDGARGRIVRIRACDPLHAARRRCRVRRLENTSAATLAAEIAAASGLTVSVRHDPPSRPLIIQRGESDLALLRALAADSGLYPVVRLDVLHLFTLAGEGEEVPLRLGHELHSVRLRRSIETELRQIDMVAWDPATLEPYERVVRAPDTGFSQSESHDNSGRYALDRLVGSDTEAAAIGAGMLDRASTAAATVAATCAGNPRLAPGARVALSGIAGESKIRCVVTEVVHRIDAATGYITTFETTPPPEPRRAPAPTITWARVCATDDPDNLGRCRVRFITFGQVESGWFQTLTPGAGNGKGLTALPELGDEVLIALPDGDPARGFVMGGLFGQQRLPRGTTVPGTRPFVLRTADGQTLELGGDPSIARLSSRQGSLVELTPERMRVAAATDLVIEAPGRTITIRADAIKLEQG